LLRVGLTGGIASGKSTVGEMFVALGAHLIRADEISHQLMQPGQAVYEEVVRHFGRGILDGEGKINRARLAEAAFGSGGVEGSRIRELNQIVHPAVLQKQAEWMDEIGGSEPGAIAVVEAALLLEAGAAGQFDRLVVVTCRPEQRVRRWAERMHVDEASARREVTRRMAAQTGALEGMGVETAVVDMFASGFRPSPPAEARKDGVQKVQPRALTHRLPECSHR